MDDNNWNAEQFERQRPHLGAVAYRMLGSLTEADDAVQEAWLRLNRYDRDSIDNLRAWLTTAVGRVCIDMLRAARPGARTSPEPGCQNQSSAPTITMTPNSNPSSPIR